MVKVLASAGCYGATASADPWVPLTVSWQVDMRGGPLYLYINGQDGGYVELNVDPDTGSLCDLVVVDLPPVVDRVPEAAPTDRALTPVLDLDLWEWKITPDYKEPGRRDIDAVSLLAHSMPGELFALWFSDLPVGRYLVCGEARVGISVSGDLVSVVVPRPPVVKPKLSMG